MRDEVKHGLGCMSGVVGAAVGGGLTVIGLGWVGIAALLSVAATAGWVIAGVGVVVLGISAVYAAMSGERAKEAASRSWAIREYRSRLDEIDTLAGELLQLASPERLSPAGAEDVKRHLEELRVKKEQILKSLLELDTFLKDRRNRPMVLQQERRTLERRIQAAPADVKPILEQNLAAIGKTEDFLEKVRIDRAELKAQLDKILFGLRNTKAQMVAEVAGETADALKSHAGEMVGSIRNEVDQLNSSIKAVDGLRAEIEDINEGRTKKKAAARQVQ